jgi:quinol monooxygenase YgiN
MFSSLNRCGLLALLLATIGQSAGAQPGPEAIYGVTSLDVAPSATDGAIVVLKQYRDAALKQGGNSGVTVVQEVGWPNRFLIFEAWKDQAAYDANETAVHTAQLRDKLKPISFAPYDRRDYRIVSVGPARTAAGGDTIYMQAHVDVFPPGIDATLAAMKQVAEAARRIESNLRYDVVQSVKPPQSHSTIFAAWQNRTGFNEYEMSSYARQFRNTVGPLLGSPFDDRLYTPLD